MSEQPEQSKHLEPADLAAYLDGQAGPEQVRRIEAHLSTCEVCRAEAASVFRTVEGAASRPRRWYWIAGGSAAAAAIVALVIGGELLSPDGPDPTVFRASQDPASVEGVPRMTAHRPQDRRTLPRDSVVFVWEARGTQAVYRFTLTDDAGDVLWRMTTTDTLLNPDDAVLMAPDRDYFWIVDALYEGGRSATTGARSFRVRRE